jgi:hypothetical protein
MRNRHRARLKKKPNVEVSVEVLEKCLDTVAFAIECTGERGAVKLPMCIEAEPDALRKEQQI